jgi:hypothetical protein
MSYADSYEHKVNELNYVKGKMEELLDHARRVLGGTGSIGQRAEAYWLAHIAGALEGRGSMVTLEDTINELMELAEDEINDRVDNAD